MKKVFIETFELLKRVVRISIIAGFAALMAGGPALHYAPFLGLHSCSNHEHFTDLEQTVGDRQAEPSLQVSNCSCGTTHFKADRKQPTTIKRQLTQDSPGSGACDETCSFCQFFSQLNLETSEICSISYGHDVQPLADREILPAAAKVEFFYNERGPPIA